LTGDTEYIGYGQDPGMALEAVRRHVVEKELSGIPLGEIREEWHYYSPEGERRTYKQFMEKGGSFDYIAGSDGRKYIVNASVERKGPRWNLSGIGNWTSFSEPAKSEEEERRDFEEIYGKKKGDRIYDTTIREVRRRREDRARKKQAMI